MKKLLLLCCLFTVSINVTFSQKSKPVVPTPRPVAKGPVPYVLKKDYEPQIEELKAKVNAAANAAASARNSVDGKFNKVLLLDSQMQEVQNILNSASFQIAMNADSLKETRFSMEEFQKKTDANFSIIQESQASFEQKVWMLFGLALTVSVIVLIIVLVLLQKRINMLQNMLHKNEEVAKKSLSIQLEKQQKELKDELQSSESRMLVDIGALKKDLTAQTANLKTETTAMIDLIAAKVTILENPPSETTDTDPEIFI